MYTKTLALAALAVAPAVAAYDLNVYFGQGLGSKDLATYCDSDGFEYLTVAFVNNSPEQDTSGLNYPGTNFGPYCGADVYTNGKDGPKSKLLSDCKTLARDIKTCQSKGKKVLLSIGGAWIKGTDYTVSTKGKGEDFADFLWEAFGPKNPTSGYPRPFDIDDDTPVVVDGFDFDIEHKFDDESGYVALINKLRSHFAGGNYLITGAPQCPLSAEFADMNTMITEAKFDKLWIQFYNNPSCDAIAGNDVGDSFNFKAWAEFIAGGASKDALLYVGLPGSPDSAGSGYLDPDVAYSLIRDLKGQSKFGGAMVWDLTSSEETANGRTYYEHLHDALVGKVVPTSSRTSTVSSTTTSATPTGTGSCEYTIQSGDSCWLVAKNNGLTTEQLLALNPGLNCDTNFWVGKTIYVSACPTTSATSTTSTSTSTSTTSTSSTSTSIYPTTTGSSTTSTYPTDTTTTSTYPTDSSTTSTYPTDTTTTSTYPTDTTTTSTYPTDSSTTSTYPTDSSTTSTYPTDSTAASSGSPSSGTSSSYLTISAPYGNSTTTSGSASGSSSVLPVTTDSAYWTTSTVYATSTYTISSCAPTVTNCPYGQVTTVTTSVGVTTCPVVDVTATVVPVTTTSSALPEGWTTSTVYTTKTLTITSCAPTVTECPARTTVVTVPAYVTVCPISEATGSGSTPSKPAGGALAGSYPTGSSAPAKPTVNVAAYEQGPTTTIRTTSTGYTYVTVPGSSKGASTGLPKPSSNGTTLVVSYSVQASATLPTGSAKPSPTKVVTAGAGRNGAALGLAGLIAVVALAL